MVCLMLIKPHGHDYTQFFWHFWTFHVKRMFQENSPVHINVCETWCSGWAGWIFLFFSVLPQTLHPVNAWFTYLVLYLLSKITKKKEHVFGLYQPWNIIQHPEAVQNWIMGRRCDVPVYFQMFSSGKRSRSAGLIPSDANLSLAICSSFRLLSDPL